MESFHFDIVSDICFSFLLDGLFYFILERNIGTFDSSIFLVVALRLMNMNQFRTQTMNELVSFCIFFESVALVPVFKVMIQIKKTMNGMQIRE